MVNFKAKTRNRNARTYRRNLANDTVRGKEGGKIYSASLRLLKGNSDAAILNPVKRRSLFLF